MKARKDAQEFLQRHIKPLTPPRSFVPGNKVWLDAKNLNIRTPSRKLSPRRYGPYEVIKQISPVTYRIKLPPSLRIKDVFHMDLLILFHETKEHGANYPQPALELIDGEEEYEVERVIDKRTRGCTKEYLIKWKGYSEAENMWVKARNISAPEKVAEYQKEKGKRHKKGIARR